MSAFVLFLTFTEEDVLFNHLHIFKVLSAFSQRHHCIPRYYNVAKSQLKEDGKENLSFRGGVNMGKIHAIRE